MLLTQYEIANKFIVRPVNSLGNSILHAPVGNYTYGWYTAPTIKIHLNCQFPCDSHSPHVLWLDNYCKQQFGQFYN